MHSGLKGSSLEKCSTASLSEHKQSRGCERSDEDFRFHITVAALNTQQMENYNNRESQGVLELEVLKLSAHLPGMG
jgi:2'-5' RNA ligase